MKDEIWYWFKELVIELRRKNNEIMKQENGIFVAITLIDRSINDYISFNPHSINLTGKPTLGLRNGHLEEIDIKYLLQHKTIRSKNNG